jgi:uroporphyrinogen decarboxylase
MRASWRFCEYRCVDPRRRVEVALREETLPDRPPVTAWGHDFLAEWSPDALAESTVERALRLGWDLVKLQPRASCFAEAFGSDYRPSGTEFDGPGLHAWPIERVESWGELPDVDASVPPLADQVEACARVVDAIGDERPVFQTVFSPFTVASYLAADGRAEATRRRPDLIAKDQLRAVSHLRERPELLAGALVRIAETLIDFLRRSLAAGADGIFYAVGGAASADALDEAEYRELLLPHDGVVLDAVPAETLTIVHLCGPRLNFDLVRQLRVDAVSWAASDPGNPSLAEGRARSGVAVVGGVSETAVLVDGSPVDVRRAVRDAVDETGGRGLVVAPSCSVPPNAPLENLAAMAEETAAEGAA